MKRPHLNFERLVNSHLQSLPADKRPELPNRSRAQSIAHNAGKWFEITDREEHTTLATAKEIRAWLKIKA